MAQQTLDRQVVLRAWRRLSPEHRQVLIECYFRGASVAAAAKTLGLPAGTVKSRTYYALRNLRDAIDEVADATPRVDLERQQSPLEAHPIGIGN
jgi:RNA polymerase sigma-70 factor (ECF subfamily)